MTTLTLRSRVTKFFRSTRVRAVIVIVGGYNLYHATRNYSIIYKPFSGDRHRPGETVLDLNLDAVNIVEHDSVRLFSSAEEIRLERLITTLKAAKNDPRVTAVVVRGLSGLSSMGLADLTELRNAISDFSSGWGGKQTMLHVPDGLGVAGNGTFPLYFASAFNSVHIPPTSPVIIPGLSLATLFFKRLLDNVGLEAKKVARKDYKTMANSLTEEKFTNAHRESTESLLNAIMTEVVSNIADARGLSEKKVRDAIDIGIMNSREAHEAGLIDEPLHRDELPSEMRRRLHVAAEAREAARLDASVEWNSAMRELYQSWTSEEGVLGMWEDGTVSQNLADNNFSVLMSVILTDSNQEITRKTTEAEIRALKAHIRWLDTCPWEFYRNENEDIYEDNVYQALPYVSSLLNLERRLCEQSIRALEQFPGVIQAHRKGGEDNEERDSAVARWVRGVWKAKCLAARIVGTLKDSAHIFKKEQALENGEDALLVPDLEPRPFLVGYIEDFKPEKKNSLNEAESPELEVESSETSAEGRLSETKAKEDQMTLQYIKFADYIDLLSNEHRAYAENGNHMIRMETRNSSSPMQSTIDNQDRQALIRLQSPGHRLAPWRLNLPKGHAVAVIRIGGLISDEGADATRAAIRRADKDPNVKAIVLRIDSPGGSAIASDIIARAVDVANKPVVASMGNICASGGYYIAAPCNLIFTSPMTLTGSIGVIFQYFNASKLFDTVGITGDTVETGKFAKHFSALALVTDWSDDFMKRINAMIDGSYAEFLNVVAKGRGFTPEEAEEVAQGRVWAGSDAMKLRLADRSGGLCDAIGAAAELANLAPDVEVRAVDYPTLGMQVQDAARRRGIMPAHLDEEGDEVIPEKRRRRWLWRGRKQGDEQGEGGKDESGDESDNASLIPANTSASMGGWGFGQYVVGKVLLSVDRFLMSASSSAFSSNILQALLGKAFHALSGRNVHDTVLDELEAARVTSGRPAAIAPNIHIDE